MLDQEKENALDVGSHGTWGGEPILSPPFRSTNNLALRASLDDIPQGHG